MLHTLALLLALPVHPQEPSAPEALPAAVRFVELDGDGMIDRLIVGADGSLAVALNRGARLFEPVVQELPAVLVTEVLAGDLNADGHPDLYLVSPGDNVALVGDGTGRFVDATEELGLADGGAGLRAERLDLDADGTPDVLLHNLRGDVLFWGGAAGAYERDPATPPLGGLAGVETTDVAGVRPGARADGAGEVLPAPTSPFAGRAASSGAGRIRSAAPPAASASGSRTARPAPGAGAAPVIAIPTCAKTIEDATTGECLPADSTPTLGRLYPLGPELFIDPGGAVGVNTLTPESTLDVQGDFRVQGDFPGTHPVIENTGGHSLVLATRTGPLQGATPFYLLDATSTPSSHPYYPVLNLGRTNAVADGDGIGMFFNMGTNSLTYAYGGVVARAENGLSSTGGIRGALDFYVNPDDDIVVRSKMTVSSGGNVGIRTQTPVSDLHVVGDGAEAAVLVAPDTTVNGASQLILAENVDDTFASFRLRYDGTSNDRFLIQSDVLGTVTDRLVIMRSDGNVGIGTGAPQARLQVAGGETLLEQEDWSNPSFQNGWVNYGSGYLNAGYFEDSLGVVHLRGLVRNGTFGEVSGTIFTLPVGYRPAGRVIFSVMTSPNAAGRVDVLPTGDVRAIAGSSGYLSLEGISFRAL